ncbi:alpha/beta hydrolase [Kitasatospora sp. MBT66]|uniref:alpha/beta hydrolase n=1 Tax=Kitasatospora sp. MBT66 TaxID=1444769 RepID=UPI000690B833|nr:alpha/beta hydrolase [Kitasatospora sp. MBT66]
MTGVYELLLKFDPQVPRDAAKGWKALAHAAESTGNRHRNQVNGPLHAHWTGADADGAFQFMARTEQQLDVIKVEAEAVALTLNTVADRMYQAQTNLTNAVHRAQDSGLVVSADGVVGLPPEEPGEHNDPDAQAARRTLTGLKGELQARIDAALKEAQRASDQGNTALGRLGADILSPDRTSGALAETRTDAADVMKDLGLADAYIPDGKDPKRNAEWWTGLSADQQETFLALNAARIGSMDGLPATARDEANRLVLDQKLDALDAGTPAAFGLSQGDYDQRRAALRTIKDKLAETADARDEEHRMFLLGIDPEAYGGDGRAIVATGNPDKATHTAVFVPGTNTEFAGVPGQIDRIRQLQGYGKRYAEPGESVSVISYLGYDTPESIPKAANPRRGIDGAEDMRRFSDGLRVAHGEPRSHVTYVAHSYGSYAVGVAARGGDGLHADDIVTLGSPGTGVDNAKQLHIDPNHVWISEAEDDMTRFAGGLTLGPGPHNIGFGGNNLYTDTSGHGGYWDRESDSVKNQGKIIAGKPPEVVPKEINIGGIIPVWH